MALTPGTRLGQYEILSAIGAGGMGEVYRARDPRLDREVAIKVLSAQLAMESGALARFAREAMSVAKLSHPNILAIHEFGRDDGTTFVVTELVDGATSASASKGERCPATSRRVRASDRQGDCRRARPWHRASRSQARERDDHARRAGQDSRLRSREAGRPD
jgi:serine/threonine protein kinase